MLSTRYRALHVVPALSVLVAMSATGACEPTITSTASSGASSTSSSTSSGETGSTSSSTGASGSGGGSSSTGAGGMGGVGGGSSSTGAGGMGGVGGGSSSSGAGGMGGADGGSSSTGAGGMGGVDGGSSSTGAGGMGGADGGSGGTPCSPGCGANQICVVPACRVVLGEECYFGTPDAGAWSCPPGTKRAPQFDHDCLQPGFACVTGCPPAPAFCLDLPAECSGVPTCACLGENPCHASNSGACLDSDIADGKLACSLKKE